MPSSSDAQRRTTGSITLAVAVVAFFVAVLAVVVAADTSPSQKVDATATGGLTPSIDLTLSEFKITPASVTADPGPLVLHVVNNGTMAHNLSVKDLGKKTVDLQPGASAELSLGDVAAGHYTISARSL